MPRPTLRETAPTPSNATSAAPQQRRLALQQQQSPPLNPVSPAQAPKVAQRLGQQADLQVTQQLLTAHVLLRGKKPLPRRGFTPPWLSEAGGGLEAVWRRCGQQELVGAREELHDSDGERTVTRAGTPGVFNRCPRAVLGGSSHSSPQLSYNHATAGAKCAHIKYTPAGTGPVVCGVWAGQGCKHNGRAAAGRKEAWPCLGGKGGHSSGEASL